MAVELFLVVLLVQVVEGRQHDITILVSRVDRREFKLSCDF
jgi:hypothetical protein